MEKTNIFKSKPLEVHFTIRDRVPYNKLLTNLACSSRTGEYWPSVVFVRTSLCLVRTATTSGQYSPVRPSRSGSKRLLFRVITEEPSQHVRSDSVFASQNPRICWTNVRCPALICRLATCMIQSPDLNAFDKNLESINLLILRTNCLCNYCQS